MENKISLTIQQLEYMLNEQKKLVIDQLLGSSSYYNNKSTDSISIPLDINKDCFKEMAFKTKYPNDFEILKKYL